MTKYHSEVDKLEKMGLLINRMQAGFNYLCEAKLSANQIIYDEHFLSEFRRINHEINGMILLLHDMKKRIETEIFMGET